MINSRINYWSCSRFADWIRGGKKPPALQWDEWEKWREENRRLHPLRFFLAEEVLDRLQDLFMFPWDIRRSISAWWDNRFVSKTHVLKTGLPAGKYHELDTRILHGLFNELVEFVEVELAHMQNYGENEKKYRFKRGRCPEAGVDHLEWAMGLKHDDSFLSKKDPDWGKPTPQAKAAAKTLELYRWWKEVRPARKDPHDASGWSEVWDKEQSKANDKAKMAAIKRLQKIEEEYDGEDEKMLVRLIKIRKSLWT